MRIAAMFIGTVVLASSGCTVGGGSDQVCSAEGTVAPMPIRRLSRTYLENSVKEFFSTLSEAHRADLIVELQSRIDLIPVDAALPFSSVDNVVAQDHVDAVLGLATAVLAKAAPYAQELASFCGGKTLDDDGCLTSFVQRYGRKAFRRPLTQAEVDDFKAFYKTMAAQGDGESFLLARMIAHPNFYYRLDNEGELVSGSEGQDAQYRLNKWELLSKMTFLFWAAPPTDALYDRVDASDITGNAELAKLADDILADPRAEQGLQEFFREWLVLDKTYLPGSAGNASAGTTLINAAGLTALTDAYRDEMNQEVLDLMTYYALTTDGTVDDILTSPYSFARGPTLAKVYGVDAWDGNPGHLVSFPQGQRSGLLSRAALVASNTEYTRPIIKGVKAQLHVMCGDTPPPPPNLQLRPVLHTPEVTTRQATETATSGPGCQGCHASLNALGFATEHYDSLGRYRDQESKFNDGMETIASMLNVDSTSTVFLPSGESREVADAIELGKFVAESGDVHQCLAKNYFAFSVGRQDEPGDACNVQSIGQKLTGTSIKSMLRDSVMSPLFRQRKVK